MTDKQVFLKRYMDGPTKRSGRVDFTVIFAEVARLSLAADGLDYGACDEESIIRICDFIDSKQDCIDFVMQGVLRILARYGESPALPRHLGDRMRESILAAPYWIDEPGTDRLCMFTENHLALYHTCEYLAGQLYPDENFSNNGRTGRWHMEHAEPLLRRWLENRRRFGFCEWLSNSYYDEDLLALANLYGLSKDAELRELARGLIDILLFDIAAHTHDGVMGCSHGRAYTPSIVNPANEPVRGLMNLFYGVPCDNIRLSLSAPLLCDGDYEMPQGFRNLLSVKEPVEIWEHHSFRVEDGASLGMDPADPSNITTYWAMQVFEHPLVLEATLQTLPDSHYHANVARSFAAHYEDCRGSGRVVPMDLDYFALTDANVYTYRTPAGMISAACGFRPGEGGYQQHIWQATLGGQALVFATQPGTNTYTNADRPNQFHGNGVNPRAVAYKGMVVAMHVPSPALCRIYHTHAYFPKAAFDEVAEDGGWVFGRKGGGYVALYSLNEASWGTPAPEMLELTGFPQDAAYERIAGGGANVWICELGQAADWGSFARFVTAYSAARISGDPQELTYVSPANGVVHCGYRLPLQVEGCVIPQNGFPRHKSRWMRSEYGSGVYRFL